MRAFHGASTQEIIILVLALFLLREVILVPLDANVRPTSSWSSSNSRPSVYPNHSLSLRVTASSLPKDESESYLIMSLAVSGIDSKEGGLKTRVVPATLATHMTPHHLLELVFSMTSWDAVASVSVFITSESEFSLTLFLILHLQVCYPEIYSRSDFHFVFLQDDGGEWLQYSSSVSHDGVCSSVSLETIDSSMQDLIGKLAAGGISIDQAPAANYDHRAPYPNNLLRNVAIAAARTDVVLTLDADMIPSPLLASTAVSLPVEERIALVVPG